MVLKLRFLRSLPPSSLCHNIARRLWPYLRIRSLIRVRSLERLINCDIVVAIRRIVICSDHGQGFPFGILLPDRPQVHPLDWVLRLRSSVNCGLRQIGEEPCDLSLSYNLAKARYFFHPSEHTPGVQAELYSRLRLSYRLWGLL